MEDAPQGMHTCPSRSDGRVVLFAHRISASQCDSRQRGLYHKCFSCDRANAVLVKAQATQPRPVELIPVARRAEAINPTADKPVARVKIS